MGGAPVTAATHFFCLDGAEFPVGDVLSGWQEPYPRFSDERFGLRIQDQDLAEILLKGCLELAFDFVVRAELAGQLAPGDRCGAFKILKAVHEPCVEVEPHRGSGEGSERFRAERDGGFKDGPVEVLGERDR